MDTARIDHTQIAHIRTLFLDLRSLDIKVSTLAFLSIYKNHVYTIHDICVMIDKDYPQIASQVRRLTKNNLLIKGGYIRQESKGNKAQLYQLSESSIRLLKKLSTVTGAPKLASSSAYRGLKSNGTKRGTRDFPSKNDKKR